MYTHGDEPVFAPPRSRTAVSRGAAIERLPQLLVMYREGDVTAEVSGRTRMVNDMIYEAIRQISGGSRGFRLHRCPQQIEVARSRDEMFMALAASIDANDFGAALYWLDVLRTDDQKRRTVAA